MSQSLSGAEQKALSLLGNGFQNHVVAQATGLSDSRISQLLSEDWFKNQVNDLKYQNLLKHNLMDERYDNLETTLVEKLEGQIGLMFRPMEVLKSLQVVNSLKRRGVSSPDNNASAQKPAHAIVLPTVILQQFTKTINNVVVQVEDQPLVTIQPGQLQQLHHGTQQGTSCASPEDGTKALTGPQQESNGFAGLKERLAALRARQNESLAIASEN